MITIAVTTADLAQAVINSPSRDPLCLAFMRTRTDARDVRITRDRFLDFKTSSGKWMRLVLDYNTILWRRALRYRDRFEVEAPMEVKMGWAGEIDPIRSTAAL